MYIRWYNLKLDIQPNNRIKKNTTQDMTCQQRQLDTFNLNHSGGLKLRIGFKLAKNS